MLIEEQQTEQPAGSHGQERHPQTGWAQECL
jgi:hypothetical protein